MTLGETHKADVHEKLGEYPDAAARQGDNDGDDVEYEADDGDSEEEADETQDAEGEV